MSEKAYHNPVGDPCKKCGRNAQRHRVEHIPEGDPCKICKLPLSCHRDRNRRPKKRDAERMCYIGIDGEGKGRTDHRYVLLAASNETGDRQWHVMPRKGKDRLTTIDCLELILRLPYKRTKIFAYSFNYDLTKILQDVDDDLLYELFRPELRQRHGPDAAKGPRGIKWGRYTLNLQGTKFTVRRGKRKVIIWDLFKFFQAKFVDALKTWKVGYRELWERMSAMKDKRAEFDKESDEAVRKYCLEECACIAQLAHRLIEAHEKAGLNLRTYYGAGSSGAAMLTAMGIKNRIAATPPQMKDAVASAFFGGRFENSVIGEIKDEILYDYDISSAYPYQLTFLPCLVHSKWTLTTNRYEIENGTAALVRYRLGPNPKIRDWGPFPFRTKDGSICFPITSGGGWVWRDEYIAGEKHFPHVEFVEAWVCNSECNCQPFSKIPEYYIQRLILGKEGPGLVLKLGCNSCYGKLAQSVGNALFNSWIWAGIITSGCRGQILDLMALHKDRSNLLTIATDGIKTRERISTPKPKDTGTAAMGKPLGGWEEKICKNGLFVARPGIYFPLNPTREEIKEIRGRGVGKGVVLENWRRILDAWNEKGIEGIAKIANVTRFCGAKTSISHTPADYRYHRANYKDGKRPRYGQWITRKVEMSFFPMPKREEVNDDGLTLKLRSFPKRYESVPYDRALHAKSEESIELKAAMDEVLEQPDADLTEYEFEN